MSSVSATDGGIISMYYRSERPLVWSLDRVMPAAADLKVLQAPGTPSDAPHNSHLLRLQHTHFADRTAANTPHATPTRLLVPGPGTTKRSGFATRDDLECHYKGVDEAEPTTGSVAWYRCPVQDCDSSERLWARLDNLRVHVRRMHEDVWL